MVKEERPHEETVVKFSLPSGIGSRPNMALAKQSTSRAGARATVTLAVANSQKASHDNIVLEQQKIAVLTTRKSNKMCSTPGCQEMIPEFMAKFPKITNPTC